MIRRRFVRPLLAVVGLVLVTGSLAAAERHREFVEQLREQLYFDTAIDFLDDLATRPGLDDATKSMIVYERAVTLQEFAQVNNDPDERVRMLDDAEKLLDEFTRDYPADERIADANSRRAKILLDKAESEVYRAESPSNAGQEATLRERARKYIETARGVFTTARKQHQDRYETFPKFTEDDAIKEERTEAEYQMIQARIDLAMCTYMEARTYPDGDAARERLFGQAAEEFRAIRDDHRRQRAGLYADLWEAKCYEEQGQLDRAIPLYDRLIREDERSVPDDIRPLHDQALRFKLGCWNKKEEYKLVYKHANEDDGWLKFAGRRADGLNGLGIRWELARAEEQLAYAARKEAKRLEDVVLAQEKRSKDRNLNQAERSNATSLARDARKAADEARDAYQDLLRSALTRARTIAQYATHYQEVAVLMSNRVQVELEGNTKDPETFKEGFVQLQLRIGEIQDGAEAVEQASPDIKAERQAEHTELLNSTARLARLTLDLADAATDEEIFPEDLDRAWYLYAYVEYQRDHPWETAVIGRHLFQTRKTTNPETAKQGGFLAVAAMQAALVDVVNAKGKEAAKDSEEFAIMLDVANDLVTTWPNERMSDDARLLVGDEFKQADSPLEAARWYEGVSESSPRYLESRLAAGQGYYRAFSRAANAPEGERPEQAQLDEWRKKAIDNLRLGVEKKQAETPEDAPDSERFELIRGKITFAEILIADGQEQAAVDLFTQDPHAVLKAIEVPPNTERPENGLKSAIFAQSTYTLLLRAYIGLQKTDEALQAMEQLEAVAGGASVELYQQLGLELQKEIENLRELGDNERLAAVRSSFDVFLAKVYENRETLGYNSLLWIGSTYFALGKGMGEDPAAAEYYEKSGNAYAEILDKASADPDFAPGGNLNGVRLQLVRCRTLAGEYDRAYDLGLEVLAALPNAMDAQFEMARVLQAWADSSPPDAVEKYRQAMLGGKADHRGTPVDVYGYKKIADVYGNALATGRLTDDEGLQRLTDAYYNLVDSQRGLALAEDTTAKREAGLKRALMLFSGVRNLGGSIDHDQKERFQQLHDRVNDDLGVAHTAIVWPENIEPSPPPPPPKPKAVAKTEEPEKKADEAGGGGILLTLLIVLLGGGAAVGMYVMMSKPRKRTPAYAFQSDEPEPTFASAPQSAAAPRRKKAKRPEEAAARKPAEGAPVKKKRPRPPQ